MRSIRMDILSHDEGKIYVKHTGDVTSGDIYAAAAYLLVHGAMIEDERGRGRDIGDLEQLFREIIVTVVKEIGYERDKRAGKGGGRHHG